mmetsp:Transcript_32326/g.43812  ORF Transcript_32326/g.43812 Transcript_32326/m.43812 type:complete len:82 (+) Transcript_32326:334-579(+)
MGLLAMISARFGSHFSVALVALWRVPACTGYKPPLADDQIGGAFQGACGPCERTSMDLSVAIASRCPEQQPRCCGPKHSAG